MHFRWIQIDNTRVLFHLSTAHSLHAEWHPVGQVTLRQVYESQTPAWYAWNITHEFDFLGSFPSMEEAVRAAELANHTEGAPTS